MKFLDEIENKNVLWGFIAGLILGLFIFFIISKVI